MTLYKRISLRHFLGTRHDVEETLPGLAKSLEVRQGTEVFLVPKLGF
jgi:hypothetical protein